MQQKKAPINSNPCFRCGKERILLREYKENVGGSLIITREMICPDKECQKIVNQNNKKQNEKNALMRRRSEQRALGRKAASNARKATKNKKN